MCQDIFLTALSKALKIFRGIVRWTAYLLLTVVLLFALLVITLRIPAVQTRITQAITHKLSERTGAEINIGNVFLTYSGGIELNEIFVGRGTQDTILHAQHIDTRLAVMPLFKGNIQVSHLNLNSATVYLSHSEDSVYNFQFIIESFSTKDSLAKDSAESTSPPTLPDLSVGPVKLKDCQFGYIDSVLGVMVNAEVHNLDLLPGEIDLSEFRFFAHQVNLDGSNTYVELFKAIPPKQEDTKPKLPVAGCSNLLVSNSRFTYHSIPHNQTLRVDCPNFSLEESSANLPDSSITAGMLRVEGLEMAYETRTTKDGSENFETDAFSLPGWEVIAAGIDLNESKIQYRVIGGNKPRGKFDPNMLNITNLNFALGPSNYSREMQDLDLQKLSFVINEEFKIAQVRTRLIADHQSLNLEDFILDAQNSSFDGDLKVNFEKLQSLIANPLNSGPFDIKINRASIMLEDFLYFDSELDTIEYWHELSANPVLISGGIKGQVDDLYANEFKIEALASSAINIDARLRGLPELQDFEIQVENTSLHTEVADIALLIDTSGMSLPLSLDLYLKGRGTQNEIDATLDVQTNLGAAQGQFELRNITDQIHYHTDLSLKSVQIGQLAGIAELETVSGKFQLEGTGTDPYSMNSELKVEFDELVFMGYDYYRAKIDAELQSGNLSLNLNHRNKDLVLSSEIAGVIDSLNSNLTLNLNLEGADLQQLGLSSQKIKTSFDLEMRLTGTPSNFSLKASTDRLFIIGRNEAYRADSVFLAMHNRPDSVDLKVHTEILRGELHSNRGITELSEDLAYYLGLKLGEVWDSTDGHQDLNLYAHMELNQSDFLTDILLPDLEKMDTIRMEAQFIPGSHQLTANLTVPEVVYGARSLDSLSLEIRSTADSASANLEFDRLSGQWLDIRDTKFRLQRQQDDAYLHLLVNDPEGKKDYDLTVSLEREEEDYTFRIVPDSLVINEDIWSMPVDNYIKRTKDKIEINEFRLTHNNQKIELKSQGSDDELEIIFMDFDLDVIFALLNSSTNLLEGRVDGSLQIIDALRTPGFEADLNIKNIALHDQRLGDLQLTANKSRSKEFDLALDLSGPELEFNIKGAYNTDPSVQKINLAFSLEKLELPLLKGLFPESIDTASGELSAKLNLTGDLKDPDLKGDFQFHKAGFSAKQVGSYFLLKDELISIDNSGLSFDRFSITDENNNLASIIGGISFQDALNPAFDLTIEASDFQLLKAKENSNPLYFGEVLADLDIRITGDLNLPIIRSKVVLQDATDFNYIVPASKTQLESRSGIVEFDNVKDTLRFMTIDSEEATKAITGLDLESRVILRNGTQLRMILNQRTGDNLFIKGSSDLNLIIKPNGEINLTGIYELNDGGYKLNFFELVNKEFGIRPGSKIVWTGAPMGAELNITAVYEVRTSAASLMDDPDPQYNRVLPFEVLLFIKGSVEQPEISFQLDMPPDKRGALGGNVYGKIKEVNLNETELNKQVFTLIVFDRFIPSAESGDAGISTADIALSSVGDFVSGQLNNLSEKYLKGVELNVDIGSYTDYGSGVGRERTDLNVSMRKAFFDDRFSVEVGSNMALQGYQPSNEIVGDVALEYKLTEDGRYRLRGYRRNDFENPIEGQVIITGAAIIFSREFGTWNELFRRTTPTDTNMEQNHIPEDE